MSIQKLKNRFVTGAWISNVKTFFDKINEIIDYLNGVGTAGDGSYTEYRALLTQTSTNAPVEDTITNTGLGTAFVNTIGGTWSYNNVGSYYYTKANAFTDASKIEVVFGINGVNQTNNASCFATRISANVIEVQAGTTDQFLPLSVFTPANDVLVMQPISIRVYN